MATPPAIPTTVMYPLRMEVPMRWALATTLTATGLLSGCNEVTIGTRNSIPTVTITCLLYTSDAADE